MNDRAAVAEELSTSTRWGLLVALVAMLLVAYLLRYVLLPFVIAAGLAYVARPVLRWLRDRVGLPRWAAALLVYLLFLATVAGAGFAAKARLVPELTNVIVNAPELMHQFLLRTFGERFTLFGQPVEAAVLSRRVVDDLRSRAGAVADVQLVMTAFGAMMGLVLTLVLLAFFLFTGPELARGAMWLVPPHLRPRANDLAGRIDPILSRYVVGVFLVVLYTATATWVMTGPIFRVSHAILLALAVGVLELVPVIGPILSFIAFALLAVQEATFGTIVGFGVFTIALRVSIDQLVAPLVLGRAAKLPAALIIFAFLAGGAIYGILGMLLAIPFAAATKVVLQDLYDRPRRV